MLDDIAHSPYTFDMEVADIAVLYQDHHMLVVNKPAGVVIHPTYKHADDTMWDALLVHLERQGTDDWQPPELPDEAEWLGAPEHIRVMLRARRLERLWQEEGLLPRPCLLHRLDKDTSGVVALARTAHACTHLARQFHAHTADKHYLALVRRGAPAWARPRAPLTLTRRCTGGASMVLPDAFDLYALGSDQLVLDGPLQRDPDERRRCIVGPDGQQATTALTLLTVLDEYALLDVTPITGRTHQIRAHLAAYGYAIVGDQMYASPPEPGTPSALLTRQFLHAWRLTLRTYPDNVPATFIAPPADDLLMWMQRTIPAALALLPAGG